MQGCNLKEKDIHYLPFFKVEEFSYLKPFETIIKQQKNKNKKQTKIVQEKRRKNPKGTISNIMYKEIGNSI